MINGHAHIVDLEGGLNRVDMCHHANRLAEHPAEPVSGVHTFVQEGPTPSQHWVGEPDIGFFPVPLQAVEVAVSFSDHADATQDTAVYQLLDLHIHRIVAHGKDLHVLDTGAINRLDHPVAVFQGGRHRLLAGYVLASLGGGDSQVGVL